ncbi:MULTISPECIES: spore cortex-lytic enzyme [Bacillus]|uniref:spore cortex-lytic enzyme n=1 Tax=Bacillus TaxID=1386 RepID=UPI000B4312D4|nr:MULTISPECIES: spore cortex-lytic enzyme [Bacillus]
MLFTAFPTNVHGFTEQVIQKGAVGDDVIELQARLQNIGFYNGKIDGVFGWGTYWALRNFQYEFGMPIDGLAGEKTKSKLVKASNFNKEWVHEQINKGNTFTYYGNVPIEKQVKQNNQKATQKSNKNNNVAKKETNTNTQKTKTGNVPNGFSNNDINLLAQAVYGEARGEPYEGQVAVAAVILNRLESPSFPNTVSGIIFEPLAFTAVADGQINLTPNETARKAVIDAINGMDPSGNATYYFNPETATSKWIWSRPQIKKIGKHIFCE